MSMAGTPKAKARKAHTSRVAAARAHYRTLIQPAQEQFARAVRPHQQWLRDEINAADREFADTRRAL